LASRAATGAAELVAQTRASVAAGCFSNTDALHWHDDIAAWPLAGLLDHRSLSFKLGVLKPDVVAFAQVAGLLEVPAERVLFLDDNALNVTGAAAAGFQVARAAGVAEAPQRLSEAAVLGTIS
jgi:glucose-1-phosphatase